MTIKYFSNKHRKLAKCIIIDFKSGKMFMGFGLNFLEAKEKAMIALFDNNSL